MRFTDLVVLAWRQLRERRLRALITIAAVSVGVVVIVVLSAEVASVKASVLSNLESLGPNTIVVVGRGRMPLTDADVARIKSLPGVSEVIPLLAIKAVIPGLEDSGWLVGVSAIELRDLLGNVRLSDGYLYYDAPAPQAIVGSEVASSYGSLGLKAGQPMVIYVGKHSLLLTVTGVLDTYGTSILFIQVDDAVFVPITYLKTLMRGGGYDVIVVKASTPEVVDEVSELLKAALGGRARVMSVKQVMTTVTTVMNNLNTLLTSVASTAFIAAGLGTFNIMMVTVLERVREIGVLKALGMRDSEVLKLYLMQGVIIGTLGAVVGTALGILITYTAPTLGINTVPIPHRPGRAVAAPATHQVILNTGYIILAATISIAVATLSAAYPAWRAAKLNPTEALRYE